MIKGSIQLFVEELDYTFENESSLKNWINEVLKKESIDLSYLNIIVCSDEFLLGINKEYLDHDFYTDIITFQYNETPVEGELFISLDRVKENAQERGIAQGLELNRVIIHGVLHLSGYKDKQPEDKKIMTQKEDEYLSDYYDLRRSQS